MRPALPFRHRLAVAALALVSGVSLSGAAPAQQTRTIDPGYWSFQASNPLTGGKGGDQCVAPDKIDEFLAGPHNRHYHCTYPVHEFSGGQATLTGECLDKSKRRYKISLKGRYAPESFSLNGHVAGSFLGLELSLPISIEARRLAAECPAHPK